MIANQLKAEEVLSLLAAGWEAIEGDGERMTIQAPEHWDEPGPTELVIDTGAYRQVAPEEASFQDQVAPWMQACFGPVISADGVERGDRLLEEVLELLQSGGYNSARVLSLRDYVYGRVVGEPSQEVGGVMVTLAAYCLAFGLDMHEAAETELARIWTKVENIRAKQLAKPTGSALPIAVAAEPGLKDIALQKAADQFTEYARQHRAKGTHEADLKALTNDHMAGLCRAALSDGRG